MIAELSLKRGVPILASRIVASGGNPWVVVSGVGRRWRGGPLRLVKEVVGFEPTRPLRPWKTWGVYWSVNPARSTAPPHLLFACEEARHCGLFRARVS
jgi:hypothetical protein